MWTTHQLVAFPERVKDESGLSELFKIFRAIAMVTVKMIPSIIGSQIFLGQCDMLIPPLKSIYTSRIYQNSSLDTDYWERDNPQKSSVAWFQGWVGI
jgi:hypothetical protein